MGWLSGLLGAAAPVVGGIFGGPVGSAIGGAVGGLINSNSSSQPSGQQTTTQQQQLDPRIQSILFGGSNGNGPQTGLLSQYQALGQQPQNAGINTYGRAADQYVGYQGTQDQNAIRDTALNQMKGNIPSVVTPGSTVNAPSQNNLDLSGAYSNMINGNAGANPYLTGALKNATDLTNASYQQNVTNATDNLQRNVLPGIRSNSILSGQYGGSRQGIAEGNAIGDFSKSLNNANLQLGLANSANTTGAQAQSFNQGQDRSLSAMQGLGAQQYGVASQDAQLQQQANLFNNQAQQNANALNVQNQQNGINNLGGVINTNVNAAQGQDSYALNQAGKANGLLTPYVGLNGSSTVSQPMYQNTGGNILGGATAGLGLYSQLQGIMGNGYNGIQTNGTAQNYNLPAGGLSTNPTALQNINW